MLFDYDAWSGVIWSSGNNERAKYIGKETDAENGDHNHGVRQYSDYVGRFLCPDEKWSDEVDWTPYHYSKNNPVNSSDGNGYADGPAGAVASNPTIWQMIAPYAEALVAAINPVVATIGAASLAVSGDTPLESHTADSKVSDAKTTTNATTSNSSTSDDVTKRYYNPDNVLNTNATSNVYVTTTTSDVQTNTMQYKAHSDAKPSTYDKHTKTRAGGDPEKGRYGKNRNNNRGDKNTKYTPKPNPNKRIDNVQESK